MMDIDFHKRNRWMKTKGKLDFHFHSNNSNCYQYLNSKHYWLMSILGYHKAQSHVVAESRSTMEQVQNKKTELSRPIGLSTT